MTNQCSTCNAYRNRNNGFGVCMARPPVPIIYGMQKDALGRPVPYIDGHFPPMKDDGWCREHQPINASMKTDGNA